MRRIYSAYLGLFRTLCFVGLPCQPRHKNLPHLYAVSLPMFFQINSFATLLQTGATSDTHLALSRLVGLVVHVMLLVMVFRSRKAAAAAIRGAVSERQDLLGIRGMLADSWPFVATFVIVAMWLVSSAGAENGFQHVLQVFAWSAAVIVCASLVSIFALGAIDRAFIENSENKRAQLGQSDLSTDKLPESAAKNTYHLLVYRAVSTLIGIVAFIALLQVWGVDTLSWF